MTTKTLRQNAYTGFTNKGAALTNDEMDNTLIGLSQDIAAMVPLAGNATLTGILNFNPSTTSGASLNINSGAAPTSPNNGDMWASGGVLTYFYGGTANSLLSTSGTFNGTVSSSATINAKSTLFSILDAGDTTRIGKFVTSSVPTGTTVSVSFPAVSGTMATLAGSEAFTNKTIDASTIGATTASSAKFTTLQSSGVTALGATSAASLDSTPIGGTTASTGVFTTLATGSTATFGGNLLTALSSITMFATPSTINFGGIAAASTTNIQTGAIAAGTKAVNIGTGSAAGSTTVVTLGSTAGTSQVNVQGSLLVNGAPLAQNGVANVPIVLTSATTLASGNNYECNTTSSAFSVTLPASPAAGAIVKITDYAGTFATNNLTVLRNSSNIMFSATDLIINARNESFYLVYVDSTKGWSIQI